MKSLLLFISLLLSFSLHSMELDQPNDPTDWQHPQIQHLIAQGVLFKDNCLSDKERIILIKNTPPPTKITESSSWRMKAYNPHDPNQLVRMGGDTKSVHIWDIPTQTELHRLPHPAWVYAVAYNPHDPNQLATGCRENNVRIWDLTTRKELYRLPHPYYIMAVAYNPHDPNQLATGCVDKNAHIWDLTTRKELYGLSHPMSVTGVAYNPHDPNQLATGCADDSVHIWDLTTRKELYCVSKPQGSVSVVAYNPHDPNKLAIGSCIWDISALHTVQTFLDAPKKYLSELFFLKRLARAIKEYDSELTFNVNKECPLDLDNPPADANERASWERKLIKYIPGGIEHNQQKEYFWRFTQMPDAIKVIARKVMKFAKG